MPGKELGEIVASMSTDIKWIKDNLESLSKTKAGKWVERVVIAVIATMAAYLWGAFTHNFELVPVSTAFKVLLNLKA